MPLTLVTGRANAGKTAHMHGRFRRAVAEGRRAVLLLPSAPDVARARREFAPSVAVGARIEPFDRYLEHLWDLFGDGRPVAQPVQGAALAALVVREAGAPLAPEGGGRGLARAARVAFGRLHERPEEEWPQPGGELGRALLDSARRYRSLSHAVGLADPAEAVRLLAALQPATHDVLVVHRFTGLTPPQEAFLIAAATAGVEVTMSLPWAEGHAATEALTPLAERLRAAADEVVAASPDEPFSVPELARLEAGLFAGPRPAAAEGAVQWGVALGDEAEVALAVDEVGALLAEGFLPHRVAVVARDATGRGPRLAQAFAAVGIPADLDAAVPLGRTPFGRALRAALRFEAARDGRPALLAFLHGPFSGADHDAVSEADARWRRGRVADVPRLRADARRLSPVTARVLDAATRAAEGGGAVDAERWQSLLDALLSAAHVPEALVAGSPAVALDAAAHRAATRALAALAELGDVGLCLDDALGVLEDAEVAIGPVERPGHVQIAAAHRLRARRFEAVVLVGLTADEFAPQAEEGAAAPLLEHLGLPPGADARADERLLFYQVVTRARRRLVLIRRAADSEGRALRPSPFWEEVLDLYREPDPEEERDLPERLPAITLASGDLPAASPFFRSAQRERRILARQGRLTADDAGRAARRLLGAALGRGRLTDAAGLEELAARTTFAVTEVESYAACPYRWFYERLVRPRRLDREVDAREQGTLAHQVLGRVYSLMPERLGVRRVTPKVLPRVLSLAEEVFADECAIEPHGVLEAERLAMLSVRVQDLLRQDQDFLPGFEPAASELRFGDEGELRVGGAALSGSVDRVDEGAEGFVLTDYKWSRAPKRADFGREAVLQLPLYAVAVSHLLGRPVLGGFYRSLASGSNRGWWLRGRVDPGPGTVGRDAAGEDEAAELLAVALARAEEAVFGMRAGRIPAEPAHPGACAYCGARGFCSRGEGS